MHQNKENIALFHLMLDLDGVVLHGWHHDPKHRLDWSATIKEDIGFPKEAIPKIFMHPDYKNVACGRLDLKEHLYGVFSSLGIHQDIDTFVSYWHRNDTNTKHLNKPLLAYVQHLRSVHGIKTCLVTQQEKYRAHVIRNFLGLEPFFDELFFSCDIGFLKNDPAAYRHIADVRGIDPATILFFDDTPEYIAAAQAAGWPTAQYVTLAEFENHPVVTRFLGGNKVRLSE